MGMIAMNATIYLFNVVAARALPTHAFGALTALFGVILVGNVAALALQATTARRIAIDPDHASSITATTTRVTLLVAGAVALLLVVLSPLASALLRLDSIWPIVLCGVSLVPLTIMGAQSGVAQGTERWNRLALIYVANGVGRLIGGTAAVLISPTETSAMVGVAAGAWLPVVAGWGLLTSHVDRHSPRRTAVVREVTLSSHALLAYFVLSNLDALLARNLLSAHDAGLYASGLILAKSALFFPQFISVVFYPDLARATGTRARLRAAGLVSILGGVAVVATALLPNVALILVGGDRYAEIASRLWLFALAGSTLAVVHLLVFDALARRTHGVVALIWVASAAVVVLAYGLGVGLTGIITVVTSVAVTLAVAALLVPPGPGALVGSQRPTR